MSKRIVIKQEEIQAHSAAARIAADKLAIIKRSARDQIDRTAELKKLDRLESRVAAEEIRQGRKESRDARIRRDIAQLRREQTRPKEWPPVDLKFLEKLITDRYRDNGADENQTTAAINTIRELKKKRRVVFLPGH